MTTYTVTIKKILRGMYELNSAIANGSPRIMYGSLKSVKEQYSIIYGSTNYSLKFKLQ